MGIATAFEQTIPSTIYKEFYDKSYGAYFLDAMSSSRSDSVTKFVRSFVRPLF